MEKGNLSRLFNNYNNYVINNGERGLISETVTTNSSKALLVLLQSVRFDCYFE